MRTEHTHNTHKRKTEGRHRQTSSLSFTGLNRSSPRNSGLREEREKEEGSEIHGVKERRKAEVASQQAVSISFTHSLSLPLSLSLYLGCSSCSWFPTLQCACCCSSSRVKKEENVCMYMCVGVSLSLSLSLSLPWLFLLFKLIGSPRYSVPVVAPFPVLQEECSPESHTHTEGWHRGRVNRT